MTILPDSEAIVISALQRYHAQTYFRVPADLFTQVKRGPVIVVYKTGGKAPVPGMVDSGMFTVQVFGADRRDTSTVARQVREWLHGLCRSQTRIEGEGYLANFREVSGPMSVSSDELSSSQPDLFRFVASYMVATKPL